MKAETLATYQSRNSDKYAKMNTINRNRSETDYKDIIPKRECSCRNKVQVVVAAPLIGDFDSRNNQTQILVAERLKGGSSVTLASVVIPTRAVQAGGSDPVCAGLCIDRIC